jgi:cytochrome b6-f complex iron-sulfur subunit
MSANSGDASQRWRITESAAQTVARRRASKVESGPVQAVDTPVASQAPRTRPFVSRRTLLAGGFWSGLGLAMVGLLGSPLSFLWPRKVTGFGGKVTVPAARVPAAGSEPVHIPEGKFFLANLAPGQEESPGGLLALWHKCPHLGCSVPWRPDFEYGGSKGWYRCPCHGSTYTRGAGLLVFGPAPRPLDTMAIDVKDNGDVVVNTGAIAKGGKDNPQRTVPYPGTAVASERDEQVRALPRRRR